MLNYWFFLNSFKNLSLQLAFGCDRENHYAHQIFYHRNILLNCDYASSIFHDDGVEWETLACAAHKLQGVVKDEL